MFSHRFSKVFANVPPALWQVGIFITDVYKYTEKSERKKLKNRREVQTLTITDKHPKPHLHKTAVSRWFYYFAYLRYLTLSPL